MKKKRIIHSALSLSLTAALCLSMAACGGTQTPADSGAASQPAAPSAAVQPSSAQTTSAALPVKALNPKQVEENPYMAKSDANIHHDGYNTDSTDEILPLGIFIPRSTFPTRQRMQMLLPPSILTATAMLLCRCWAALPSAT